MLPALYHDIILEFWKNKRLGAIFLIYFVALSCIFFQVTHAFFTSTGSSTNNTFVAAAEFPLTAPLTSPAGSVVINEIMWPGSSKSVADEWIELRNMTGNTYDMTGWQLIGAGNSDITIPSGTLTPNGLFLISNFSHTSASSILNVPPDYVTSSIGLDNVNLKIFLANQAHDIVDIADDGVGTPFAGSNIPPKKSMERNNVPGNGMDPASWHTATSSANLDPGATESATPRSANNL